MPSLYEDSDGVIRALVDRLGHDLEPSILIGGWATHIRVGGDISLDIDLITSDESRHKLRQYIDDLSASTRHQGKKFRGTVNGVHLDIYIPFESQLGDNLRLKVEVLAEYVEPEAFQKWTLLILEAHIATKIAALLDRHATAKGQKDAREILALIKTGGGADAAVAAEVLVRASTVAAADLPAMIGGAFDLIGQIIRLDKAEKKLIQQTRKRWVAELTRLVPQEQHQRPRL